VLAQTYRNTEVVVVDDGSTDDTQTRLSAYRDRIRILTQENSGPAAARNRGIALAQGEIIAFLDSDDYWLPTKLARQVDLLEKAGKAIPCCICDCTVVYRNGRRTSAFQIADTMPNCSTGLWLNPAEVLSTRFVLFNQAVAIRREVLEKIGYFDEALRLFCEDHELALRLSLEGPWAIIRDQLVVYQDASPDSLGQKALTEEVLLREHLLHMRRQILRLVENNPRHSGLRRLARKEFQRASRELVAARLSERSFPGASTLSKLLHMMEHVRRALFRRSPLYPRMAVRGLS
jgi:glycosyltransferase involved in cell wall biosynthesis